jgi:O-antigen ligase
MRALGVWFLYVFLFLAYSRILDFHLSYLHLPLVMSLGALPLCILSSGVPRALGSRSGMLLTAFTACVIAGIPFAYWRGGALEAFRGKWLKSYLLFILIAGLLRKVHECRRAMEVIAISSFVLSLIALRSHVTVAGRLALPGGAFSNPNDLAQVGLIAIPFWSAMWVCGRNRLRKPIAVICAAPVLWTIANSGSRSAMLTVAVCGLLLFARASMANKFKLVLGGIVLLVAALALLPPSLRARYFILFKTEAVDDYSGMAVDSSLQRKELLIRSIKTTLANPILGVGIGNFQAYTASVSAEEGRRAAWREAHNAYTQVSSETGIPAFCLYLSVMVFCWRSMGKMQKIAAAGGRKELAHLAGALQFSLTAFSLTAFFSSSAYDVFLPTLAGLCTAFLGAAGEELRLTAEPPVSSPAPAPRFPARTSFPPVTAGPPPGVA